MNRQKPRLSISRWRHVAFYLTTIAWAVASLIDPPASLAFSWGHLLTAAVCVLVVVAGSIAGVAYVLDTGATNAAEYTDWEIVGLGPLLVAWGAYAGIAWVLLLGNFEGAPMTAGFAVLVTGLWAIHVLRVVEIIRGALALRRQAAQATEAGIA